MRLILRVVSFSLLMCAAVSLLVGCGRIEHYGKKAPKVKKKRPSASAKATPPEERPKSSPREIEPSAPPVATAFSKFDPTAETQELAAGLNELTSLMASEPTKAVEAKLLEWSARLSYLEGHTPAIILLAGAQRVERSLARDVELNRLAQELEQIAVPTDWKKAIEEAKAKLARGQPSLAVETLRGAAIEMGGSDIADAFAEVRESLRACLVAMREERPKLAAAHLEEVKTRFERLESLLSPPPASTETKPSPHPKKKPPTPRPSKR